MCAPVGTGLKLLPRSLPRLRPRLLARDVSSGLHWRTLGPWQHGVSHTVPLLDRRGGGGGGRGRERKGLGSKPRPQRHKRHLCENCTSSFPASEGGESLEFLEGSKSDIVQHLLRQRRQLKWDSYDSYSQEGRTTTVAGFIDWGPTGTDDGAEDEVKVIPKTTTKATTTTSTTTTTTTTTRNPQRTHAVVTTARPRRLSTTQPAVNLDVTAKPQKPGGDTPGKSLYKVTLNFSRHNT